MAADVKHPLPRRPVKSLALSTDTPSGDEETEREASEREASEREASEREAIRDDDAAVAGSTSDVPNENPQTDARALEPDAGEPQETPARGGGDTPRAERRRRGQAVARRGRGTASRSRARRLARERTVQALYQWDMAGDTALDVRRQFLERQPMDQVDREYFIRTFEGVTRDIEQVDAPLDAALDRPLADVDPIERAVLRLAVFELVACLETPGRVVINEAIEITRRYGADRGHAYVNAVLDRMLPTVRPHDPRRRE